MKGSSYPWCWASHNTDGVLDEMTLHDRTLTAGGIAAVDGSGTDGRCRPDILADGLDDGTTNHGQASLGDVGPANLIAASPGPA